MAETDKSQALWTQRAAYDVAARPVDRILAAWDVEHPGQDWRAHEAAVWRVMEARLAAWRRGQSASWAP